MKILLTLLVILATVAVHESASAYLNDVVGIHETNYDNLPKDKRKYPSMTWVKKGPAPGPAPSPDNSKKESKKEESPEAIRLLRETSDEIRKALSKDFPCLKIITTGDTKKALAELKRMEFVGPKGEQWLRDAKYKDINERHEYTSEAEEEAFQKLLQAKLEGIQAISNAKYAIFVIASVNKLLVNLKVRAVNKSWAKRMGVFYEENKIYPSVDNALTDTRRITGELVDAFVNNASDEKSQNNEVCPFTGKVEVKATSKRKQQQEDKFPEHCNGADYQRQKIQSININGEYLWQFNRIGNPDTDGTVAGSITGKQIYEDVSGCYECRPGKMGFESIRSETEITGKVEGLDTSTWTMKKEGSGSDNKDATIRLHFSKDGTYKMVVRAVSKEGTKNYTRTLTAKGTCDLQNEKPKIDKQPFTIPIELQFGPFTGTVRDKRLKDKKTLILGPDELTEEVTEYTVDFDLNRPEGK